jgi:hypothetical protein
MSKEPDGFLNSIESDRQWHFDGIRFPGVHEVGEKRVPLLAGAWKIGNIRIQPKQAIHKDCLPMRGNLLAEIILIGQL